MAARLVLSTACLAAVVHLTLVSIPAQAAPVQSTLIAQEDGVPRISSFDVKPNNKFDPGTELVFTIEGTPKAKAFVTLPGTDKNIVNLKETKPGVYTGGYKIQSDDSITKDTFVKGDVQIGGKASTASIQLAGQGASIPSPGINRQNVNPNPQGGQQSSPQTSSQTGSSTMTARSSDATAEKSGVPKIANLKAEPANNTKANAAGQFDEGTEIVITLQGDPGGRAILTIAGVPDTLTMQESKPGVYQTRYKVERRFSLSESTTMRVRLQQGDQVNTATARIGGPALNTPQMGDVPPPSP